MNGIATELQYGGAYPNTSITGVIYNSSQGSYTATAGSYHNLSMALPGLTDSFATSIEAKYTAGTDMGLKNWAGYDHDATAKLLIIINNGSRDDVFVRLFISDNTTPGGVTIFVGTVLRNNLANVNIPVYDTGVPAFSTYSGAGGYWLSGDINCPTPSGPVLFTVAGIDVDNLGTGTIRLDFTNYGPPPGGPWNLDPGSGGAPFFDVLVSGSNGNPFPNDGVSWNKRTGIIIDIF